MVFFGMKAAMQETLRKKAELQAQARKPMGYAESMEAERRKQKSLEKSKEERRQALCEELGRGCWGDGKPRVTLRGLPET